MCFISNPLFLEISTYLILVCYMETGVTLTESVPAHKDNKVFL